MDKIILTVLFLIIIVCLLAVLHKVDKHIATEHFNSDSYEMNSPVISYNKSCCNRDRDIILIENSVKQPPEIETKIVYQCPPEEEEEVVPVTCEWKCTKPKKCSLEDYIIDQREPRCHEPVPTTRKPIPPETLMPINTTCPPAPPIKKIVINSYPDPIYDESDCEA